MCLKSNRFFVYCFASFLIVIFYIILNLNMLPTSLWSLSISLPLKTLVSSMLLFNLSLMIMQSIIDLVPLASPRKFVYVFVSVKCVCYFKLLECAKISYSCSIAVHYLFPIWCYAFWDWLIANPTTEVSCYDDVFLFGILSITCCSSL
jgi:hypothetical protein